MTAFDEIHNHPDLMPLEALRRMGYLTGYVCGFRDQVGRVPSTDELVRGLADYRPVTGWCTKYRGSGYAYHRIIPSRTPQWRDLVWTACHRNAALHTLFKVESIGYADEPPEGAKVCQRCANVEDQLSAR